MTIARLIGRLNESLSTDMMVVCDVGNCLFAAVGLRMHAHTEFLAFGFCTTLDFAVPAALDAQIARPDRRALVLFGANVLQITGTEFASQARFGLAPMVIVFNNCGYSTEQFVLDGLFNNLSEWRFDRFGELFAALHGFDAPTEDSFEQALNQAIAAREAPSIINMHLDLDDPSPPMRRLAEHLKSQVRRESR